MNCVIIDDEPLAHKVLAQYINDVPHLKLKKQLYLATEALAYLSTEKVDLLFLDINMPKLSGVDFLKTMTNPPLVIFTTAYQEYAIEGFELNVCDYLLKPFSFERFLKAVTRASESFSEKNETIIAVPQTIKKETESIFIKGDKKLHQVYFDTILFLESFGSYIKVHTDTEIILTLDRLSHYQEKLPESNFIRIHKSNIINIRKVKEIESNRVIIGDKKLTIGATYRQAFKDYINRP